MLSSQGNAGQVVQAKTHISETATQADALLMISKPVAHTKRIVLERTQQTSCTR